MSRSFSSLRSHLLRKNFLTSVHNYSLPHSQGWLHGPMQLYKASHLEGSCTCSAFANLKFLVILLLNLYFISEIQWVNGARTQAWNFSLHRVSCHSNAVGWFFDHLPPCPLFPRPTEPPSLSCPWLLSFSSLSGAWAWTQHVRVGHTALWHLGVGHDTLL